MPNRPLPVQLRGSGLARAALRLAGWTLRFNGLPGRQGVLIVYPHTSNWDFALGLDYGKRQVGVERFVTLSGDAGADLAEIERGLCRPVGRRPELAAPIRFET